MRAVAVAGLLILALGGCAGGGGVRRSAVAPPEVEVAHLEERALLLLLTDRRVYEPYAVERILDEVPALRGELALALGRIGDPRGAPILEKLLLDADREVRREAAFALGRMEGADSTAALLRAARDPDREVGRLAVGALARLGVGLDRVAGSLGELPLVEAWSRLLPELFRFPGEPARSLAERALEIDDPELRRWAAYALGRTPAPASAPALRRLLEEGDPWVRSVASRGLGGVGEAADLARLRPLLSDPSTGVVVQALRAARALVERGRAGPDRDWRGRLAQLMDDPRPGVAVTAIETAGAWLLDEELGAELSSRARAGAGPRAAAALLALARGGDPRAHDLAAEHAGAGSVELRRLAARAAAALARGDLLATLSADPAAPVRLAALEGVLGGLEEEAGEAAAGALADPDPGVRAAALAWLVGRPLVEVERVRGAMAGPEAHQVVELGLYGTRAVAARGRAEPRERGLAVRLLEELGRSRDWLVRREAAAALEQLGQEAPAPGPATAARALATYRDLVRRTRADRWAELRTRHGPLRLRLDCPRAPLTCTSFLQLATQGFYDGLPFHRVVADFVVQTGDPRGDGWGGPGWTLRDEVGRGRFVRGVAGMALSGPDSGGSQFFITLSPQPHLDGIFTPFAEVVGGVELLDRIEEGDRVLGVAETGPPGSGAGEPRRSGAGARLR